jgi:hypothetical protein
MSLWGYYLLVDCSLRVILKVGGAIQFAERSMPQWLNRQQDQIVELYTQ